MSKKFTEAEVIAAATAAGIDVQKPAEMSEVKAQVALVEENHFSSSVGFIGGSVATYALLAMAANAAKLALGELIAGSATVVTAGEVVAAGVGASAALGAFTIFGTTIPPLALAVGGVALVAAAGWGLYRLYDSYKAQPEKAQSANVLQSKEKGGFLSSFFEGSKIAAWFGSAIGVMTTAVHCIAVAVEVGLLTATMAIGAKVIAAGAAGYLAYKGLTAIAAFAKTEATEAIRNALVEQVIIVDEKTTTTA